MRIQVFHNALHHIRGWAWKFDVCISFAVPRKKNDDQFLSFKNFATLGRLVSFRNAKIYNDLAQLMNRKACEKGTVVLSNLPVFWYLLGRKINTVPDFWHFSWVWKSFKRAYQKFIQMFKCFLTVFRDTKAVMKASKISEVFKYFLDIYSGVVKCILTISSFSHPLVF